MSPKPIYSNKLKCFRAMKEFIEENSVISKAECELMKFKDEIIKIHKSLYII